MPAPRSVDDRSYLLRQVKFLVHCLLRIDISLPPNMVWGYIGITLAHPVLSGSDSYFCH